MNCHYSVAQLQPSANSSDLLESAPSPPVLLELPRYSSILYSRLKYGCSSLKKKQQRRLKTLSRKRVKVAEASNLHPVCKYCWIIVRPIVVRHAECWTKDYELFIASGMANCSDVDEEIRVACDCYYEDEQQKRRRTMSSVSKTTQSE